MTIEQIELGKMYYLPVRVTEFNYEVGDEEPTVRLGNLSGRHQLVDFGKNIMNELVEIDLRVDQPKPVVPQTIFDVIENFDDDVDYLHEHMGCQSDEVREWLTHNERDFYEAWLAYPNITVEKEKLYTVEIPNPNGCNLYLIKLDKEVTITSDLIADAFPDNLKLTEQEIRKDFDWAWEQGFAEEVTERWIS